MRRGAGQRQEEPSLPPGHVAGDPQRRTRQHRAAHLGRCSRCGPPQRDQGTETVCDDEDGQTRPPVPDDRDEPVEVAHQLVEREVAALSGRPAVAALIVRGDVIPPPNRVGEPFIVLREVFPQTVDEDDDAARVRSLVADVEMDERSVGRAKEALGRSQGQLDSLSG